MVQQLAAGIELIDGSRFKPMRVEVEQQASPDDPLDLGAGSYWSPSEELLPRYKSVVKMSLTEGKKHEVSSTQLAPRPGCGRGW